MTVAARGVAFSRNLRHSFGKITNLSGHLVTQTRNLFSQSLITLYELRSLTFAYLWVNCAITIVETWFPESLATPLLYAPFGVIFGFYFLCQVMGVSQGERNFRMFGRFAVRYLLLGYGIALLGLYFVTEIYDSLPVETQEQAIWASTFLLCVLLAVLLPSYFFGTVLPAQIIGRQRQILAGLRTTVRQSGYMLPRFLGYFVPFMIVEIILGAVMQQPVTPSGNVETFSFLLMIVANVLGIIAEGVLWVIFARAYLKDLRERGELPAVDAEVFA